MKKILLSLIIGSIISTSSVMAGDDNLAPSALTIIKYEGHYLVGGFNSGQEFASAQKYHVNQLADDRIASLSGDQDSIEQNKITINQERSAALRLLDLKGEYADLAIQYMESGLSSDDAKKKAASETLDLKNDESSLQSGYNDNSVSSVLSEGGDAPTVSNNDFKQFNELDCSYSDVSNYIDKSLVPKTKAFSTSPNYSNSFKEVATKATVDLKGEEEASCQTIFHTTDFASLPDLVMDAISSGIPSFGNFGDKLSNLGNEAGKKQGDMAIALGKKQQLGLCDKLSKDNLLKKLGDVVDKEYRKEVAGTSLDGTRVNNLDKESGQNNFTYKLIKNQSNIADSDLIKAIDVTRDDSDKNQSNYIEGELDEQLNDLERDIFGN